MRRSKRNRKNGLSRYAGIILLEILAIVLFFQFVAFARQQRTELEAVPSNAASAAYANQTSRYAYPEPTEQHPGFASTTGKALHRITWGRYNTEPEF